MKIQFHSDLHVEFYHDLKHRKFEVAKDVDVLIFAGDIANSPQLAYEFFYNIRKSFFGHIIYFLGNHEYYGHSSTKCYEYFKLMLNLNVDILDKNNPPDGQILKINDITFIGDTLYSDLSNPVRAQAVKRGLTDFRVVKGMDIDLWQAYFDISSTMIDNNLFRAKTNNTNNKTVVITHFAPLPNLITPGFEGNSVNDGFVSDLSEMILQYQPAYWIYGHTHSNIDYQLGNTKIVCNQFGYRHENPTMITRTIEI